MERSFNDYINRIIPLLFSVSITVWILDSFVGETMLFTLVLVFILHSLVFMGMILAGKSRFGAVLFLLGTVLYFAVILLVIRINRMESGVHYLYWLANLQPDNQRIFDFSYFVATICLVSYMFSAIVFYFSCIRDRIGFLFMAGCIPLLLHTAKTTRGITLPFLFFALCFLCLYAGKNRMIIGKDSEGRSGRWYQVFAAGFALIVTGLALVLPKPPVSPKLAELEGVVFQAIQPLINQNAQNTPTGLETYDFGNSDSSLQLDKSSFPNSDRVLFSVEADEPLYLRTQSYDSYKKNRWFMEFENSNMRNDPEDFMNSLVKLDVLSILVSDMDEEELKSFGFKNVEPSPYVFLPDEKTAVIRHNRVKTNFLLTPSTVYSVESLNADTVFTIDRNGICRSLDDLGIVAEYRVRYLSPTIHDPLKWSLLRELNQDIWENICEGRLELYKRHRDVFEALNCTETDFMTVFYDSEREGLFARRYYTELPADLPARIYTLADEITSGETSDYGKAKAIENFFHTSGFRYDLSPPRLPPGRDINDYFLFESKKGYCIHFASAMVILARACGLPARFTEGFKCDEYFEQTGRYFIRANDAHAYPEIYISGYGWMTFEPTVSDTEDDFKAFVKRIREQMRNLLGSARQLYRNLPPAVRLLFIPILILDAMGILWLITRFSYLLWLRRTLKADESKAIERIFGRIVRLSRKLKLEMKRSDTPLKFADRVLSEKDIDIRELAQIYSRIRYGGCRISRDELLHSLNLYRQTADAMKAIAPRTMSWLIR